MHPTSSLPRSCQNRKFRKRAAMIALAVAAASPLVTLAPASFATESQLNAALDQALLLLAQDAWMSDAQMLAAGVDLFNRGNYEEAQTTLQQVKGDSLSEE